MKNTFQDSLAVNYLFQFLDLLFGCMPVLHEREKQMKYIYIENKDNVLPVLHKNISCGYI